MRLHFFLLIAFSFSCYNSYGQWSTPINISPGTTSVSTNENAGQCLVAVGDTIRITYCDHSTSQTKIMYNQSKDKGLTWGTPVVVHTGSASAGFTAIASSGSNVHIVWMDSLGTDRASFYQRSLDGGITWKPMICLDSVTKFWPGIACSGNLVIATLNKDLSGNTEVFIKRSLDNGTTWLPNQQISNTPNRSEDPAINILGNDVHLSWNDKRSGVMNIYYCHSSNGGATWAKDTALTNADSYTSMVCLYGNHVDVPHAVRLSSFFDVWLAESKNRGQAFIPNQQLTFTATTGEYYPFMVRDSDQLHIVYSSNVGDYYLNSADAGITWKTPLLLAATPAGQPFIAYTGCILHIIFSNAGSIYYMRNPTGNCVPVGLEEHALANSVTSISPNPAADVLNVKCRSHNLSTIILFNALSEKIIEAAFTNDIQVNTATLASGIYFYEIQDKNGIISTGKIYKQ